MNFTTFAFKSFCGDGVGKGGRIQVTPSLLVSQNHLHSVLTALEGSVSLGERESKLRLNIEQTAPFQIELFRINDHLKVAKINRRKAEALLVTLSDVAAGVLSPVLNELKAQLRPVPAVEPAFDWLTGIPSPLAALIYTSGAPSNGVDSLALCLAACIIAKDAP